MRWPAMSAFTRIVANHRGSAGLSSVVSDSPSVSVRYTESGKVRAARELFGPD